MLHTEHAPAVYRTRFRSVQNMLLLYTEHANAAYRTRFRSVQNMLLLYTEHVPATYRTCYWCMSIQNMLLLCAFEVLYYSARKFKSRGVKRIHRLTSQLTKQDTSRLLWTPNLPPPSEKSKFRKVYLLQPFRGFYAPPTIKVSEFPGSHITFQPATWLQPDISQLCVHVWQTRAVCRLLLLTCNWSN
jgi:hypothetical protein